MKEESVASPLKFVKMVLTVLVTGNRRVGGEWKESGRGEAADS